MSKVSYINFFSFVHSRIFPVASLSVIRLFYAFARNRCIRMHLHTRSVQGRFWRNLLEVFCLCSSRWILISCSRSLGFTNKAELYCSLPFYARSRLSFIYFELYIFRFRDALTLPFFVSPRRRRKYFYGRVRELHSPMNLCRPRIRNWADAWNSKRRASSLLEYVIAIVTLLFIFINVKMFYF